MLATTATILALAAPGIHHPPQPCQTAACVTRVERKHWRRIVKPYRSWLRRLAACESSGNPRASNGTHFGLYQFDLATWRSVRGRGHPLTASILEQRVRAVMLRKARGTQPWECKV